MIEIVKDPNTILLLHGEDFVDSSGNGLNVTNKGVTLSTEQSKFGGKSFYFNGSAYLTAPGYNFGANDFTVDWWEYVTSSDVGTRFTSNFCTTYSTQAGGILLHCNESGLKVYTSSATNNNWDLLSNQPSGSNVLNQWVHRAAVRSGTTLMLFVNGSLEYSYTLSGSIGYNSALPMGIGGWSVDGPGTGYFFTGYIDEFRVSNTARWTSNFTPPSEPYASASTVITPGGVIPQKYALRRRMMIQDIGKLPPMGRGFANYTWAELDAISKAGLAAEYFTVGETRSLNLSCTINGVDCSGAYDLVIHDVNHDDLADGSGKAGLTIGFNTVFTCYSILDPDDSNSDIRWVDCAMRTTYLPNILAALPADLQAVIKTVNKIYDKDYSATVTENLGITQDKLFLVSEDEILYTTGKDNPIIFVMLYEGYQYEYFATEANRVKYNTSGEAVAWWTRTIYGGTDADGWDVAKAYNVTRSGTISSGENNKVVSYQPDPEAKTPIYHYTAPLFCI